MPERFADGVPPRPLLSRCGRRGNPRRCGGVEDRENGEQDRQENQADCDDSHGSETMCQWRAHDDQPDDGQRAATAPKRPSTYENSAISRKTGLKRTLGVRVHRRTSDHQDYVGPLDRREGLRARCALKGHRPWVRPCSLIETRVRLERCEERSELVTLKARFAHDGESDRCDRHDPQG